MNQLPERAAVARFSRISNSSLGTKGETLSWSQRCVICCLEVSTLSSVLKSNRLRSQQSIFALQHLAVAAVTEDMGAEKGTRVVADAIGALEVAKVVGPTDLVNVPVSTFWCEQPVVIHVFRRFGCQLCRGGALEMGKIFPQLEANGVRVVGIGVEKVGVEDFQKGGFWKGELYIDNRKTIHKALYIQKVELFSSVRMLFGNKEVKNAIKRAKDTPGDLKGDGRQLGGTFILAKGGETLLDFHQSHFGDHATNVAILEALGLDTTAAMDGASGGPSPVCTNSVAT